MKRPKFSGCALFALFLAPGWFSVGVAAGSISGSQGTATISKALYSAWARSSRYVAVRDGTRLAIDVYRPTVASQPVQERLPVILVATPFHRSELKEGKWVPNSLFLSTLEEVLKHGYVIAFLDLRGRGASFGKAFGGLSHRDQDRWDLYDVIEWLAQQPWSDGQIGMAGCSFNAVTQFLAADAVPPHLKAIVPGSGYGWFNTYSLLSVNGVGRSPSYWQNLDKMFYALDVSTPAPPVDEDTDGSLLREATAEHKASWDEGVAQFTAAVLAKPFRDSPAPRPEVDHDAANEWNYLANYKASHVAVYQWVGWRDVDSDEVFAWYRNLAQEGVPQKLTIGPWYHCQCYASSADAVTAEHIRWFDHWLKGLDNGISKEPPIRYYLAGAPPGTAWRTAEHWPLANARSMTLFFRAGKTGSGRVNEAGRLTANGPKPSGGTDQYVVDYTATTAGVATRWHAPSSQNPADQPGLVPIRMNALDASALTYTTMPLAADAEITGFPTVTLWVTSTTMDQDFFVNLEEVDEAGVSTLLTDGAIRASMRALQEAPFDHQKLPWHPGYKADYAPLNPGVPAELRLALYPMANLIRKGHRIRISINSYDDDNWDTPKMSPAPTVAILHDARHPSSVTLPRILARR